MKNAVLLLLIAAAIGGYYYYTHNQPPPTVVAAPTPAPTPVAIATPPPETPVPHRFAPEGVFYLTQWVKIEKDDGIVSLPPGTGVKLVKPGIYQTANGEYPIDAAVMTNDLDIAHAALAAGKASHEAGEKWKAAQERGAAALAAAQNAAAAANNASNLAGVDRDHLTRKLEELRARKAQLEASLPALSSDVSRANYGRVILHRIETGSENQQLADSRAELNRVSAEMRDVESALSRLK